MDARWMKMDRNGRDIKIWSVNDVIDVSFGAGVLHVKVKEYPHEWGFAIESIPWATGDKLVFS